MEDNPHLERLEDGSLLLFFDRDRYIYYSISNDDGEHWSGRELVIEPAEISGYKGMLFAVGEPSLTANGDLSFVAVYGDPHAADSTDRYDCDPWFLPKK